jgi:hypothetical protein
MVLKTSVLYDTEQLGQSMLCQCNCFFYPIIFFKISPTVQVEEHMYFGIVQTVHFSNPNTCLSVLRKLLLPFCFG